MSIELVMTFSTTLVTFLFGIITKKFEIIDSQKIPIQNVLIGILGGLMCYAIGLYDNIIIAILTCFIGAMSAGGIYDTVRTKVKNDETIE